LNTEVSGAEILADGRKRISARGNAAERVAEFDYVVNATYMNHNRLAHWLGFPVRPLRFDLLELLVLRIPIPKVAITILDGPFSSLITTGEDDLFMLCTSMNPCWRAASPKMGFRRTGDPSVEPRIMPRHRTYFPISTVRSWSSRASDTHGQGPRRGLRRQADRRDLPWKRLLVATRGEDRHVRDERP
jgi:hypothetical protein